MNKKLLQIAARRNGRIIRKIWQRVSWPVVVGGLSAPFIVNCGALLPGVASGVSAVKTGCPNVASVDALDAFDFEKGFNLNADVAAKVKAGVGAAVEMKELADKIDGDLKTACSTLAHDLGGESDYKDGQEACHAAIRAINQVKAKLGKTAKISLEMDEPHCGVAVDAYADCAGHCDATIQPGEVPKCEGGKLQGSCAGQCSGECEASAGATCNGECNGSCDAQINGTCSGNCQGKCDGNAAPEGAGAQCAGTCEGTCSGNVKATCNGKCGGSCQLKGDASCSGTCSGSCSVDMKAPKCTGKLEPPHLSAECKAKCDAKVQAKAECTPPHVALRVSGAADAKVAAMFQTAMDKDLPAVITVAVGMGQRLDELTGNVETVVGGVRAIIQTAGVPMTVGKLTMCVGAPFKGALDAAGSLKASVTISASVQARASASGSTTAG